MNKPAACNCAMCKPLIEYFTVKFSAEAEAGQGMNRTYIAAQMEEFGKHQRVEISAAVYQTVFERFGV